MLDRLAMIPLSSSPSMAGLSSPSKMNAICKTSQRGSSIRCELNQRVLRRTGTQKVSSQSLLSKSVLCGAHTPLSMSIGTTRLSIDWYGPRSPVPRQHRNLLRLTCIASSIAGAGSNSRDLCHAVRPKEVNVEHLKELSEKYKAQVHVPFHSLNHEDDEELPQSILDKADHDLVGKVSLAATEQCHHHVYYACASCAQTAAHV